MKQVNILYLVIFVFLLSCESETELNESIWIGKYVDEYDSGQLLIRKPLNVMLRFDTDSVAALNIGSRQGIVMNSANAYMLLDTETIRVYDEDPAYIDLNIFAHDSITFELTEQKGKRCVYVPLVEHELLERRKELETLLLNHVWKLSLTNEEYEFDVSGIVYKFNTETNTAISEWEFWKLLNYRKELFIVIGDYQPLVFQVSQIEDNMIGGNINFTGYDSARFEIVPIEPTFSDEDLLGNWSQIKTGPLPPLPPLPKHVLANYRQLEQLRISDTTLIRSRELKMDTLEWFAGKGEDKMIVWTNDDTGIGWDVQYLNNDTLKIIRWEKNIGLARKKLKSIVYVRN